MCVGVVVLVIILVGRTHRLVGPPLEMAQGKLLELLLGYPTLEVAWAASDVAAFHLLVLALVEGWTC